MAPLLEVRDLRIHFPTDDGLVKAVDGVSFSLDRGSTLGIVGESGSGKSVTSLGIMGLHHCTKAQITGEIRLDGEELAHADPARVRELRGAKMDMIFQDPLSSLHPYFKVGDQIIEAYRTHHPRATKKEARQRAIDMLGRVGIPQPAVRAEDYPHQFSGGMRQRVMIAMALCNDPELLIADEPTTALDVTVQAQILDLISELQAEFGSAVIIITHDLGVVAELADDILVMYAGLAVEYGTGVDIFRQPGHPYTWGLLASMPRLDRQRQTRLVPIPGTPPSLIRVPPGCPFHPRCRYTALAGGRCNTEVPVLREAATPGQRRRPRPRPQRGRPRRPGCGVRAGRLPDARRHLARRPRPRYRHRQVDHRQPHPAAPAAPRARRQPALGHHGTLGQARGPALGRVPPAAARSRTRQTSAGSRSRPASVSATSSAPTGAKTASSSAPGSPTPPSSDGLPPE